MPYKSRPAVCEQCRQSFMTKNGKAAQRFCSIRCAGWGRAKPLTVPKRRRGMIKACPVCHAEFYAKNSPSLQAKHAGTYCSRTCKGRASRLALRPCETCGETFQPAYNTSKRFCSLRCKASARKNGHEVPCTLCGTMTYLPKGRLDNAERYFCCLDHANEWQARTKVTHSCTICGKSFQWSPSRGIQTNVKYCSQTCYHKDPATNERLLHMNVQQQERKINKLERKGYDLLATLGIVYEPQTMIGEKFCVDAFLPLHNTVVQFDGDYWHGNPLKFPTLDARQKRRAALDASQDAYMAACGYGVIRVWETDLHTNLPMVMARFQQLLALA